MRELRDRRHVVSVSRTERHRGAADERRPLVERVGEALDGDAPVRFGADVDDLRPAQLLRVRDLPDSGELVLADDDPVSLAGEVERGDEGAHALRDRGRDCDVVRLRVQEAGERSAGGLVALDPELPLRAVRVPAREPLLCRCAYAVGQSAPWEHELA